MRFNTQPYNRAYLEEDVSIRPHMGESLMGWTMKPLALRFPRLAFNRQLYNRLLQAEENITVRVAMTERLTGWARIGADYRTSHRMSEGLRGSVQFAAGTRLAAPLTERLSGSADFLTGHEICTPFAEFVNGVLHMGADIGMLPTDMIEHLRGALFMCANIYTVASPGERLSGTAHLGANLFPRPALYEVLNGYASVRNIAESITVITDSIPPGAVLVIDAGNYTMTLQDATGIRHDVIHWHKGDWLSVGRGAIRLTLSGIGAQSYRWEVFYNALYL